MPTKKKPIEISDGALEQHYQQLGLKSKAEYKIWCANHGFSTSTTKSHHHYKDELEFIRRQKADAVLTKTKKFFRRPEETIQAFLAGEDVTLPKYAEKIQTYRHQDKKAQAAFNALVNAVPCDFVFENVYKNFLAFEAFPQLIQYKDFWLRDPADWTPKTHNSRKRLISFLRHLFDAGYDNIPVFMDQAWFLREYPLDVFIDWYIHLGSGANLRTAFKLPIPFTKKMAHYFMQAPDDVEIIEALRYAQIMNLGGSKNLFQAIRGTLLCQNIFASPGTTNFVTQEVKQEFWESVIRWFIANPMLDLSQVGPLLDYLNNQKFVPVRIVENGVARNVPPVQPNLSMKKRDVMATIHAMERWHKDLGKAKRSGNLQWERSKIPHFRFEEGVAGRKSHKIWEIIELCSSAELNSEGRIMGHCVGSYARSCHEGRCSIFSMTCQSEGKLERCLTLEVRDGKIVQIRGKYNRRATVQEANIVARWEAKAGLTTSSYVW